MLLGMRNPEDAGLNRVYILKQPFETSMPSYIYNIRYQPRKRFEDVQLKIFCFRRT